MLSIHQCMLKVKKKPVLLNSNQRTVKEDQIRYGYSIVQGRYLIF